MDVDRAEGMLEEIIRKPLKRKVNPRGGVLHIVEWTGSKEAYLVIPIRDRRIRTITLMKRKQVDRLEDAD